MFCFIGLLLLLLRAQEFITYFHSGTWVVSSVVVEMWSCGREEGG
jgi:hypothetical protein